MSYYPENFRNLAYYHELAYKEPSDSKGWPKGFFYYVPAVDPKSPIVQILIESVKKTRPTCKFFVIARFKVDCGSKDDHDPRLVITFNKDGEVDMIQECRNSTESGAILKEIIAKYGRKAAGITENDFYSAREAVLANLAVPERLKTIDKTISRLQEERQALEKWQETHGGANADR